MINEARRILATVHGAEPEPLHGVDVADTGSLPALGPHADLPAARQQFLS
ncbi:hypothetical protein [Streptomyces sp. NRRL B-1347]|nr:hypothetical protein [Streptomyces sp. NRRL B-1347]